MLPDHDVLFFLHIPKTAGTSLRTALAEAFPPEEIGFWYPKSLTTHASRDEALAPPTRFFAGHLDASTLAAMAPRKALTVTVLRDPDWRVLSAYRHFRRHEGFVGSFAEFADEHPLQVNNMMARSLAGVGPAPPIRLLRAALPKLYSPDWIIESTSTLPRLVDRLAYHGVTVGDLGVRNADPAPVERIPDEVIDLRGRWRADRELWEALIDRDGDVHRPG